MPMNVIYKGSADLPENIPVFPLAGALLLPRGQMPLNIFEPRYLEMVDDSLRDGHRLIGMIQPDPSHQIGASRPRRQADAVQGRLRRPHHPDRRVRRRPLSAAAHRRRALPRRGGAQGRDRLSAVPRQLPAVRRRFHRAQGRGRGRPQGGARSADVVPQGQQSQDRLAGRRERAQRGAGQRARHDVALWRAEKQALLEAPDLKIARRDPGRGHRDGARQEDRRRRRAAVAVTIGRPIR